MSGRGVGQMDKMKKLPDAEFDIMKVVWANEPPVTTNIIMQQLGKEWRKQTLISLLLRLEKRGFLRSEKNSKERTYFPLVNHEDYLRFETNCFMKNFHDNSIIGFMNALFGDNIPDESDLDKIKEWFEERK